MTRKPRFKINGFIKSLCFVPFRDLKHLPLWIFSLIIRFHLLFILVTSLNLLIYKVADPAVTSVMIYRAVFFGWEIEPPKPLAIADIPKRTRSMILQVEDGTFYHHKGIRMESLQKAWQANKRIGRPLYGGSTITMQTARTLFLVPQKSYLRKYLELIITVEMEKILSKDRIFELYLNYAEWGKGIFGINTAAYYYYGRDINTLSTDQMIRLVTLLSSPIIYDTQTFTQNGILRSRYNLLSSRFN